MTNGELIEKYRREIEANIRKLKGQIMELEQMEDRLATLLEKDYDWNTEIDMSLETIQSPDINFEEPLIVMPERLFNRLIRGLLIAFIVVLLIIEVMVLLKRS